MARALILGTAGHIDHGKTSLVKALTGIDTDRLPEEKSRGITIDIGFAALDLGDFKLGVVDVPGHERFIKNMLAGATGIDLALLVVAADDSVMPQTREHFEILQLLGVQHGVIALTKSDLVDETTREVAKLEIRELVNGTFLDDAPIIETSAITGRGIAELSTALLAECRRATRDHKPEFFRLPIDRAFVLQGHGTVVTGTVVSGTLNVGDEVQWHKDDGTHERVRVRSLANHGQSVEALQRGQRGALNLAGVPHDQVRRGQELATPGYLKSSRVLSVTLHALRTIKHRLPVRLHLGTAEVMATVSALEGDTIEAGTTALAQLFLESPVTAVWGQAFVLRDSSAEHTLGGGTILQPTAKKIRRRHGESLTWLRTLTSQNANDRTEAAYWFAGFEPIESLPAQAGLPSDPKIVEEIENTLIDQKKLAATLHRGQGRWLTHALRQRELMDRIAAHLTKLHAEFPLLTHHDRHQLISHFSDIGDDMVVNSIIDTMLQNRILVGTKDRIALASFKPKLGANQIKLKDRIVADHLAAGLAPPEPESFVNLAGGSKKSIREIFEVAVAEAGLVKVTDDIFLHAETAKRLVETVRQELAKAGTATVAEIRDWLGTTRKFAVPICEWLDRTGITKRDGDVRRLSG